ncbi:hypothetical protein GJU03_02040 [Enterobacteriaceae endosymbiont of Donacia bicoloricornis]|uniref:exodeoxyribonuclease V subunit gamma n=1 Tax=Enterobacteriaceae endosymbiont of Donacia bicoloricornis TaxID=2675772 RepID=UPI0014498C25|nr:exodeoxyribonuclease V subunit gamma [Enterobacteriaceae endosymbiont of Donacia bicoloricornis]QJC37909.1 hypothetical protein GJU03_02040 [Enterobacteriaceae endosymbiont of Donacia bicoloricornis]
MFTHYYSNDINILINIIKIQIKKKPLKNPLTPEIIVFDKHKNFSKLIKINFSKILGIYSNIKFISFDKFIWDIFIKIIPNISKDNILYKDNIVWVILLLLPKLISTKEFINFKKNFGSKIKDFNYLFQISTQISNLYYDYQKNKPELLFLWEKKKFFSSINKEHQIWQSKLWRTLLKYYKNILGRKLWYYGELFYFYEKNKKNVLFKYNLIPERIFLLDIQNIPLIYLNLLKKIEKYIEIHILTCTPSKYYWGNTSKSNKKKNTNFNTLLFSWGNYCLNNINKLINISSRYIEAFIENKNVNLLNKIKNDILYFNENNLKYKKKINYLDKSIQINICEDFYTEIKLLYNNILYTLKKNQNYFLHDIIVISPNLELYVPYINTIFKNIDIPINVYSNYDKIRNLDILNKFLFLLKIPYIDLTPKEIFFLLDDDYISNKFLLKKNDLEHLHFWIKDLGIKYGLNIKNFHSIKLPKDQYTWKLAIYRIFLGFALDQNIGKWKNLIPYNISVGLSRELIGKFLYFLIQLEKWKNKLNKKYCLKKWKNILLKLYQNFFPKKKFINKNINFILKKIFLFLDYGINIKYKKKISVKIIIKKIKFFIKKKHKFFLFAINKINFCSLNIFKNMFFKQIFVIGMNNYFYTKKKYPIIFDLLQTNFYKNNYLDEEKNLFLKIIISTEKKLFISCTNTNQINNNLSNIVKKLLFYISKNYFLKKKTINDNFIKYFYRNYKNKHVNIFNKKKLNVFVDHNFKIKNTIKNFKLKINNLINFWKHPLKGFFNQKLKIYLQDLNQITTSNTEPFTINYLQEYFINKKILRALILNENINDLYYFYLNNGILPYGNYGEIWWEEKINKINQIFNYKFQKYKYTEKIYKINFKILNIILEGKIKIFEYKQGLIKFEPKIIDIKTIFSLWIEHLILCANNIYNKKINLFIYGSKKTKYNFKFLTKKKAIFLLEKYINGYFYGINNPMFLPMKSSWAWINNCFDKTKKCINNNLFIQNQAKKIFFYYWNNNNFINENNDPYFKKLNFDLNKEKEWIKIKKLIKEWIYDLLYYNNN